MTAKELAAALERLKLTQAEAARRLGVTPTTVYRWLAGDRKIPGPAVAALKCWKELT